MTTRMTDAEIAELKVRRVSRHGYVEVLCSKAHEEITTLKAEVARLTPKRLCVLCGKEAPANEIQFRGTHPDCPEAVVDGENYGRPCMFDMTEAEALFYWRGVAHEYSAALGVIAGGDGAADEIARQTLDGVRAALAAIKPASG